MNKNYLLVALIAMSLTGATVDATSTKRGYLCLKKNDKGECVAEQYIENGLLVKTCTAPPGGTCSAVAKFKEKTATCNKDNRAGKVPSSCTASVKIDKKTEEKMVSDAEQIAALRKLLGIK